MVASSSKHRPRCFFDIAFNGTLAGRVTFELYTDICPLTCENFRALCTGEKGLGKTTEKPLHYKGTPIHRVVKDFIIQGGDFSAGNGTGGESIYGGTFNDENFDVKHDQPFLLSMANRGKDTNGSQFFITTKPAPHLDGIHTVFGKLLQGSEVVQEVENQRVDNKSRPTADVRVVNCGELVLKMKAKEKRKKKPVSSDEDSSLDESSESSSESEDEKEKKKKKKKQKEKEKEAKRERRIETVKEEQPKPLYQSELDSNVTINPEQIPDIPTNMFLLRRSPVNDNPNMRMRRRNPTRTRSGRKVKGRGVIRYHTPSRSRSRSTTPPLWRAEEQRRMGKLASDQWQPRPQQRQVNPTYQADRWERGSALPPGSAKPENRRGDPRMRDRNEPMPDRRGPRDRDNGFAGQRGRLTGRLGGRVEKDRGPRARENEEEPRKTDKGKEKETEKKHKKDKDKSHKKHKKHKKHSDKDKHRDRDEEAGDKRAPSPKPRSRSPKGKRERARSPGKRGPGETSVGASRRRLSSPSPRDGRRITSGRGTEIKSNDRSRKSQSLSPPPSRWKPGQKPWKPSDTNKESGRPEHVQKSPAGRRVVAARSPSSSQASSEERSPSPVQLRRHGPNRSPSPRHLSPQRDRHSPSRSPLPLTRQPVWPTSPSERVKLTAFPPTSSSVSPPRGRSRSRSSSSEADSSPEAKSGHEKPQSGDPYSVKNRKKYQKATEQRKRSPTLKERFKWQPPSEDENEGAVGIAGVEGGYKQAGGGSPGKSQAHSAGDAAGATKTLQEKQASSSDHDGKEDEEAGLKDLELQRTDLRQRLADLTSQNRKIQEMLSGGGGGSDGEEVEAPMVEEAQASSTKPLTSSGFLAADAQSKTSAPASSTDGRAKSKESSPKPSKDPKALSKTQRKRGHSSSSSRSRSPPKRRPRSRSRSGSKSTDRKISPRRPERKRSVSSPRRSARSRSRSPRRRSRSPQKLARRSPPRRSSPRRSSPRRSSPRRSSPRRSSPRRSSPRRSPRRSPRAPRKLSKSRGRSVSSSRSPSPRRRSRSPRKIPIKRAGRSPPARRSPVRRSPARRDKRSSSSSSRSPSPASRHRKRPAVSPRRSRSRSRGRIIRDRRRSPSRERRRPSPRRRRSRTPSPRRRKSRSVSRTRRRSRSPIRRGRSRSRSRDRRRRSPPRGDRNRRNRRSYSRSSSRSSSSRSRSRSASRRKSRSYSRSSSRSYSSSSG